MSLSPISHLNIATTDLKNEFIGQANPDSFIDTLKGPFIGLMGYGSTCMLSGLKCFFHNIPYSLKELSRTHKTDNLYQALLNSSVTGIATIAALSTLLNVQNTNSILFKLFIAFSCLYFYPIVQRLFSELLQKTEAINEDFVSSSFYLIRHFAFPTQRSFYYFNGEYDIEYRNRFKSKFVRLNQDPQRERKSICTFFIPSSDENGVIFSLKGYKEICEQIRCLQKFYAVFAKVIQSKAELFHFLKEQNNSFPKRSINLVVLCGHGSSTGIALSETNRFRIEEIQRNEFRRLLAPTADIYLHSCLNGKGLDCLAGRIAIQNRGLKVHAAPFSFWHSSITLEVDKHETPSVKEILYHDEKNNTGFWWNKGNVFHYPDSHPEIEEIDVTKNNKSYFV